MVFFHINVFDFIMISLSLSFLEVKIMEWICRFDAP